MFTGIITAVGRIESVEPLGQGQGFGVRVAVSVPAGYLDDVGLGDSIAMQGACMTVTQLHLQAQQFVVEVSAESLDKTRGYALGERINLEKALRAQDRLGGHIVTGHVDALRACSSLCLWARAGFWWCACHLLWPSFLPTKAPSLSMAPA